MADITPDSLTWWGAFTLAEKQTGRWRVGPGTVWIHRTRHEWRIIHEQGEDPLDSTAQVTVPVSPEEAAPVLTEPPTEAIVNRFSFQQTEEALTIMPALADRAVVVRPETPLYVPDGETVTLYVSTPLWICLSVGEPAKTLIELPAHRPSDTWFGPSTLEGELCYASKSMGRLQLEDLPLRPHRAVTPVQIRNKADDALLVERMRLPVGHLSLYRAASNFLWTQAVLLERARGDEMAALHLAESPPREMPNAVLLAEPREKSKTNLILRPFSMLFHKMKEA